MVLNKVTVSAHSNQRKAMSNSKKQLPAKTTTSKTTNPENLPYDPTMLQEMIKDNKRRDVSTAELIKLRTVHKLSYGQIEKLTGLSHSTAFWRLNKLDIDKDEVSAFDSAKPTLIKISQSKIMDHVLLDDEAIKELNPYQAALSFGILEDKLRLIEGKSTSNINVAHQADPAIISAIHAAISAYSGSIAGQITAAAEAEIVDVDAEAEDAPMLEDTGLDQ